MVEQPEKLTTNEARGGVGLNVVRYVLIISVILAVAAMVITYVRAPSPTQQGATTSPDPQPPAAP
ncbi:MAG: hypothetical protein DCF31_07930 [Alphaproteobacteria bacterium]|nr:MAG: hypothetical protein DCF31_07930 [Alphaproteobacteria bacterium]